MIYNVLPLKDRVCKDCLTFSAPETFGLSVASPGWDGTMEYSMDQKEWTTWDGSEISGTTLYVRGSGNTVVTGDKFNHKEWTLAGSSVSCTGNIETLLDYKMVKAGKHPETENECYAYMFYNCIALIVAPELGAIDLENDCYNHMFAGCISLTTPPALPATNLGENSYEAMFEGCTALITAPDLPALYISYYCYDRMFSGCTSLVTAPEIPATKVNEYGCRSMFYGCTSLTTAPTKLPATVREGCFETMFKGCINLTTAPELPATELFQYCYTEMFCDCTALTTPPDLPAVTLSYWCYNGMFGNCTNLEILPNLSHVQNEGYEPLENMFANVPIALYTYETKPSYATAQFQIGGDGIELDIGSTGLKCDDSDIVSGTTYYYDPGYLTFSSPEEFTLENETVFGERPSWGVVEYSANKKEWYTWDGSEISGKTIYLRGTGNSQIMWNSNTDARVVSPKSYLRASGSNISCTGNIETLLDYRTAQAGKHPAMHAGCFKGLFEDWDMLITAPVLPATDLVEACYSRMFLNCSSLTQAPELPATTLAKDCYGYMFGGCAALAKAPELPATTLAEGCYGHMFYECTSLETAPELPAVELADYCYYTMFNGCTALVQAPALPATELPAYCYAYMFGRCTELVQAPALPATTVQRYSCRSMFGGCTSLTSIPVLRALELQEYCYWYMFYNCASIKLSKTKTDEYTQSYRVPTSGTGTTATACVDNMFAGTGGTFTGISAINTTYYLHKDCQIVG